MLHGLGEVNPTHAYYNGSCSSKDTEDPSWSTSFKTRRTQKTSSALEALWKTLFVLYLYMIGTLLYLMRRSLEVLRKFHWMILGGRFNHMEGQSSHASVNLNTSANTSSDAGTGITRLKQYLTHTKGDVASCSKVTTDITKRVLASMHGKEKITKEKKRNIEILRSSNTIYLSEDEDADDEVQVSGKKRKSVGASNVRGPLDSILKINHGKTKQSTLDKNNPIKQNLKMVAWKKIATWAYTVVLPFNAIRDESFQDMIYAIGECRRAHCVNLMIGDIGEKIPNIKSALSDARAVVVLFVSKQWTKSYFAKKAVGKRVERIVAKQEFWDNVYLAYQVLAPLVDLVWLVDTEEKPCMGYIYDAMSRAKEQISKNLKAGCILNPAIFHGENSKVDTNNEILTDLYVAIDRLIPNPDENDYVREDLNMYIDSGGQFGSDSAKRTRTKFAPYIWWRSYGIDTPLLHRFAITVLSQTCSASPCERNWSAFDNLHLKKRNCLLQQKLNDLLFIQYNTRLRRRFKFIKTNKSLDPILLRDVEENDEWTIPTENEHQDFVNAGDDLLWSNVREVMGRNVDIRPSTRSKRERYRDDDDEISVGGGLEEEVNALDDLDSDAELLDCN
ncbi:zinc finger, CCHC-type containing protein [Tanacetum coccineum]